MEGKHAFKAHSKEKSPLYTRTLFNLKFSAPWELFYLYLLLYSSFNLLRSAITWQLNQTRDISVIMNYYDSVPTRKANTPLYLLMSAVAGDKNHNYQSYKVRDSFYA